jgi:nuclear transport factor 2 (NTF2) superfamily protein
MDYRDNDREIVFKVRLNQDEWNALEAASQATGYPKGTILRNYIQQLPTMERSRCKQLPQ